MATERDRIRQRKWFHAKRLRELEAYFATHPHDLNWYNTPVRDTRTRDHAHRNPCRFFKVPPQRRHIAEAKFNEIIERARRRGTPITQGKITSAIGNAVYHANYATTHKVSNWLSNYSRRRNFYERLKREAALNEFKQQPAARRRKVLEVT